MERSAEPLALAVVYKANWPHLADLDDVGNDGWLVFVGSEHSEHI